MGPSILATSGASDAISLIRCPMAFMSCVSCSPPNPTSGYIDHKSPAATLSIATSPLYFLRPAPNSTQTSPAVDPPPPNPALHRPRPPVNLLRSPAPTAYKPCVGPLP